jgi:[ribosomal protein S18]-alanine N-acetyltransferase
MNIIFKPMTRVYAEKIISWKYNPPYNIYEYSENERNSSINYLADIKNRFFAALHNGEVIGFRSFGEDGRVTGGNYDESYLDTGGGLRPDLTGKGFGPEIIKQGLKFGVRTFGVLKFRVTIAEFNQRAQKACEKIGFKQYDSFIRPSDGKKFIILTIELKNENQ